MKASKFSDAQKAFISPAGRRRRSGRRHLYHQDGLSPLDYLALIAFAVGDRFPHVVAAETGPKRPGRA